MKSRLTALFFALILILPASILRAQALPPSLSSEEITAYAEGAAAAVNKYSNSYSFGSGVSESDFALIMTILYNDYPEFFYLCGTYGYDFRTNPLTGGILITSVKFTYNMSKIDADAAAVELDRWEENILSLADPGFGELEYALFLHDYLASNYTYDESDASRDVYSMMKTGTAGCRGFALAYASLLQKAGLETSWASSAEMDHVWNLVKINGQWYHADAACDSLSRDDSGSVSHRYFLLNDIEMSDETADHYGWISPHGCESGAFETAPFRDATSPFAFMSGKWYYISEEGLCFTDSLMSEGSILINLDLKWRIPGKDSYYECPYSGLICFDGKLYFNSPDKVMAYDMASGILSTVYSLNESNRSIYGIRTSADDDCTFVGYDNGYIRIRISTAPDIPGIERNIRLFWKDGETPGDADGNGYTDSNDIILILRYVSGWDVAIDERLADINGDGLVDSTDIITALRAAAGWF